MDLKEALGSLDTLNDEHWTQNGDPKLEVLKEMTGETVTRAEVVDAAPQFNRQNPVIEVPNPDDETKPEDENDAQGDEVSEGKGREEEVATDVVETYLAGEPLMPQEFNQLLAKISDEELPVMEGVLEEQLRQADLAKSSADELYKIVKYSLGMTRAVAKARIPDVDNQTAIRTYIKTQAQARAGRHARAVEIKEAVGLDINKLDPRAPIDRAMARKTKRGGKRPTRV